jgi:hypothetical protein
MSANSLYYKELRAFEKNASCLLEPPVSAGFAPAFGKASKRPYFPKTGKNRVKMIQWNSQLN